MVKWEAKKHLSKNYEARSKEIRGFEKHLFCPPVSKNINDDQTCLMVPASQKTVGQMTVKGYKESLLVFSLKLKCLPHQVSGLPWILQPHEGVNWRAFPPQKGVVSFTGSWTSLGKLGIQTQNYPIKVSPTATGLALRKSEMILEVKRLSTTS